MPGCRLAYQSRLKCMSEAVASGILSSAQAKTGSLSTPYLGDKLKGSMTWTRDGEV
jgi:hypothetical protein